MQSGIDHLLVLLVDQLYPALVLTCCCLKQLSAVIMMDLLFTSTVHSVITVTDHLSAVGEFVL